MPGVEISTEDQCHYGLRTKLDGGGDAPAPKPTKFMTSAGPLSQMLRKRCDKSHIHQPRVSGRCAAAAFYPLTLIRTSTPKDWLDPPEAMQTVSLMAITSCEAMLLLWKVGPDLKVVRCLRTLVMIILFSQLLAKRNKCPGGRSARRPTAAT